MTEPDIGNQAYAPTALALPGRRTGNLFLMCSLAAIDGTLVAITLAGGLSTLAGAIACGLTTIAGVGAWVGARDSFGGRAWDRHDVGLLAALGVVTIGATVLAAWIGLQIGNQEIVFLPKAAGIAILLIAADMAGLHLRLGKIPAPVVVSLLGIALEVAYRWIP